MFLSVFEPKNSFAVFWGGQDLVKNVISTLKIKICRILKIVYEGYFGVFRGISGYFGSVKSVFECF